MIRLRREALRSSTSTLAEVEHGGSSEDDLAVSEAGDFDLAAHLAWIDSLLGLRGDAPTLRLDYEDLYFAPREAQRAQLATLWSFLEMPPLDAPEVDYYLSPQTAKLGGTGTYGRLPNAAQIDAALGTDDTGWLFPLVP